MSQHTPGMVDEGLRELYGKIYGLFAEAWRKGGILVPGLNEVIRFELGFGELTYREHKAHHCNGCLCGAPAKGDGE